MLENLAIILLPAITAFFQLPSKPFNIMALWLVSPIIDGTPFISTGTKPNAFAFNTTSLKTIFLVGTAFLSAIFSTDTSALVKVSVLFFD